MKTNNESEHLTAQPNRGDGDMEEDAFMEQAFATTAAFHRWCDKHGYEIVRKGSDVRAATDGERLVKEGDLAWLSENDFSDMKTAVVVHKIHKGGNAIVVELHHSGTKRECSILNLSTAARGRNGEGAK